MNSRKSGTVLPGIVLAAGLSLPLPTLAAIPLAGDALQVYGRFHMSLDINDTDSPGDDVNLNVSSNNSLLGFSGIYALDPEWTLLWQLESQFRSDSAGGELATRNTYLGIRNPDYGNLRAGYHDTPFKVVAKRWGVLNDTVADRRAILGAGAQAGDVMNARAENSILYQHTLQGVIFQVMYAADTLDVPDAAPDDNDNDLISAAAGYTFGALELSAAYEHWSNLVAITGSGRATGIRLAAAHGIGNAKVGFLFETIDTASDSLADLDRNAYGFNGSIEEGRNVYAAQLMIAGDHRSGGSSGAINFSLGVIHKVTSQLEVYGAFSITDNDSGASYPAVDGGHGDEVPTVDGGAPYALSAGAQFRF